MGELCVRGYSVMQGYWGDEASTAAVLDQARRRVGRACGARIAPRPGRRMQGVDAGRGRCSCRRHVCSLWRALTAPPPRRPAAPPHCPAAQEGWMRTGDLATIDVQGYCNIVGRIKDMVIWGGENIYPRRAALSVKALAGAI